MTTSKNEKQHIANYVIGKRVQIPAYTDLWMRGTRYGVVERIVKSHNPIGNPVKYAMVRLDKLPKHCYKFVLDDCVEA